MEEGEKEAVEPIEMEKAENSEERSEEKEHIEAISSETVKELDESKEIENMKKAEAALFLSARFLNLQELVMLTDINPLMLKEILEKLVEKYNKDESAIEIVVKENMWKMDVGQEYVSMINKLATGSAEFTKAEQETLAVIAYKQPVKQSVIIKIRGNKAYEHVKHFIDIGLVQAKKAGHTKELKLSDDFFEYFHLQKKGDQIIGIEKNEPDEEENQEQTNENTNTSTKKSNRDENTNNSKEKSDKEDNTTEDQGEKDIRDIDTQEQEDTKDIEKTKEDNQEDRGDEDGVG